MDSPTPVRDQDVPLTPTRYSRKVLAELSKEELIEKVLELEAVLNEFQESSKELEQALEEELQGLEQTNVTLHQSLDDKKAQIDTSTARIFQLTQELNDLHLSSSTKLKESEDRVTSLKQKLVSIEIANDSMESNDRILSNKLELANQFNNELLEKLAILESDLERERKQGIEKDLYISNYQREVKELTEKVEVLEKNSSDNSFEGDLSVVSMREVLSAGPPSASSHTRSFSQPHMKKSSSLKKLQDMTNEVQSFIQKSTTTGLKSTSTTTTTNQHALATENYPNQLGLEAYNPSSSLKIRNASLTPSPSSTNLHNDISRSSSIKSNTSLFSKESKKSVSSSETKSSSRKIKTSHELSPIKGSPNPERSAPLEGKPKSKMRLLGR